MEKVRSRGKKLQNEDPRNSRESEHTFMPFLLASPAQYFPSRLLLLWSGKPGRAGLSAPALPLRRKFGLCCELIHKSPAMSLACLYWKEMSTCYYSTTLMPWLLSPYKKMASYVWQKWATAFSPFLLVSASRNEGECLCPCWRSFWTWVGMVPAKTNCCTG